MASMASASSNQSATPRTQDFSKTSESGSGESRGSGGRGHRGRGGRGGRGGNRGNKNTVNPPSEKQDGGVAKPDATPAVKPAASMAPAPKPAPLPKPIPVLDPLPVKLAAPTITPVEKSQSPAPSPQTSNSTPVKPKPRWRKASRTVVPPIVVAPQLDRVSSVESPSPPVTKGRRKRDQNNKGSPPVSVIPTLSVPQEDRQASRTGPPSPLIPSKDASPRLSSTLSSNTAAFLDTLVEKVRATAMNEHRPTTPGSHIDWAGEDDDSLPDLDDWGVKTFEINEPENTMSPIAVGKLKTLPELAGDSPAIVSTSFKREEPFPTPTTLSPSLSQHNSYNLSTTSKAFEPVSQTPALSSLKPAHQISPKKSPPRTPLHPSLPAKPRETITEQSKVVKSKPPSTQTGARLHEKLINVEATPQIIEEVIALNETDKSPPSKEEILKPGVIDSIHAPPIANISEKEPPQVTDPETEEGLGSSIHAPKPGDLPTSPLGTRSRRSAPGHHTMYDRSRASRHTRPQTAPSNALPHFTRSNPTSPQNPPVLSQQGTFHARNHSSPVGMMNGHRFPGSRPVITGDALSRLARTIGGTNGGGSPSRANPSLAAVVKE